MSDVAVRKFLDLSTGHLQAHHANGDGRLSTIDGVIAYELEYGWLLWVPDDVDDFDSECGGKAGIPVEILTVQRYAREHECDYVLFDRDAPINPELPTWEW